MSEPFAWFDLVTPEPEKARKFYEELLGWPARAMSTGGTDYTMFGPETQPFAGVRKAAGEGPSWLAYVKVGDLAASIKKAKSLGAKVIQDKTEGPAGTFSVISDPTGATLALWQPRANQ